MSDTRSSDTVIVQVTEKQQMAQEEHRFGQRLLSPRTMMDEGQMTNDKAIDATNVMTMSKEDNSTSICQELPNTILDDSSTVTTQDSKSSAMEMSSSSTNISELTQSYAFFSNEIYNDHHSTHVMMMMPSHHHNDQAFNYNYNNNNNSSNVSSMSHNNNNVNYNRCMQLNSHYMTESVCDPPMQMLHGNYGVTQQQHMEFQSYTPFHHQPMIPYFNSNYFHQQNNLSCNVHLNNSNNGNLNVSYHDRVYLNGSNNVNVDSNVANFENKDFDDMSFQNVHVSHCLDKSHHDLVGNDSNSSK